MYPNGHCSVVYLSVQMQEYLDQNNSEYGHFLRSDCNNLFFKSELFRGQFGF